jgi:calcineurin-like phosphoesterase family protein
MPNIFLISDHHLSHSNILTFLNTDGTNLRSFASVTEMDEHIIACHNSVVKPADKTYFLGDVTFSHKNLHLLDRMNGEKVLIKGNHDKLKLSQYTPYFKDIRGSHQFDGMLLTHIPVHPESLGRWPCNVHGHLHSNIVRDNSGNPDYRYFNVSVERINYTPISLEQIKAHLNYVLK